MDLTHQPATAFLIVKRDLYYKPNARGYTGIKDNAGRYTLDEVAALFPNRDSGQQDGISFIPEDEAPDYSPACFHDVKADHLEGKVRDLTAKLAVATAQPEMIGILKLPGLLTRAEAYEAMREWPTPHPDDLAVDAFAAAMKAKLARKRAQGYGGWDSPTDCTEAELSNLLRDHVEKGDPLDVGNFAMMLHQRGERITGRAETRLGPPLSSGRVT